MTFTVVILVWAAQRWLLQARNFSLDSWQTKIWNRMRPLVSGWSDFAAAGVCLLALEFVLYLIYIFFRGFLDDLGVLIVNFVVVWACMQGFLLKQDASADEAVMHRYRRQFAMVFWFALLGPFGALAYRWLCFMSETVAAIRSQHEFQRLMSLLDWVPSRALGLSLAVVGVFVRVFPDWCAHLVPILMPVRPHVLRWVRLAQSPSDGDKISYADQLRLLDYAFYVWLVVLAVMTLGAWSS